MQPPNSIWNPPLILAMSTREILDLYGTLRPPEFTEMAGEYAGYPHIGESVESAQLVRDTVHNRGGNGYWLGKSFGAMDGGQGEGYNRLLQADGSVQRKERYRTRLGPSLIDGRPSYLIEYRSFANPLAEVDVVDEIRALAVGLYLLLATSAAPEGTRSVPMLMVLEGPVGPWRGPDGTSEER